MNFKYVLYISSLSIVDLKRKSNLDIAPKSNLDIVPEGIASVENIDIDSIKTDAPKTNKEIKILAHLEEREVDEDDDKEIFDDRIAKLNKNDVGIPLVTF